MEIITIVKIEIQKNENRAKIILTDLIGDKYTLTSTNEIGNESALNIVEI